MDICFIHSGKAFLPELDAYTKFFSSYNIACKIFQESSKRKIKGDALWYFMGTDTSKKKVPLIHEYTSSSVPPFRSLKNTLKKFLNTKPDFRLFLNDYVKLQFQFKDDVPYGFRDMGVNAEWLNNRSAIFKKEFDFVYTGEINNRNLEILIQLFASGNLKSHSLLLVSKDYYRLQNKFQSSSNIIFKGPLLDRKAIKDVLSRSKFGINFISDREPFNEQTSTKFLEYAALRLPVITTSYNWIRNFEEKYGGKYFYLDKNLSNFTWDNVTSFNYLFPDLKKWTWEQQIRSSGVLSFLESRFSQIKF